MADALGQKVRANEPLARRTTFRIGGAADLYVRATTVPELVEYVKLARRYGTPVFLLGRGSNVLVSDRGWRGLVIENHAQRYRLEPQNGSVLVRAESGASLPPLANRLAREGWRGLEWAIGVPSSVGAAVVGNAGAHGSDVGGSLRLVSVLDETGNLVELTVGECALEYRNSRFKRNGGREVVLEATFKLERDDPGNCIERMNRYTDHRRRTQPTEASVGSIFKNPQGDHAGRLIEAAGHKGSSVGAIEVSRVHANFFVNRGGGTSAEAMELIARVQSTVHRLFQVRLELEIELIGDFRA